MPRKKAAEPKSEEKKPKKGIIGTMIDEYNNASPLWKIVVGAGIIWMVMANFAWEPILAGFVKFVCLPFAVMVAIGAILSGSSGIMFRHFGSFIEDIGTRAQEKIQDAIYGEEEEKKKAA